MLYYSSVPHSEDTEVLNVARFIMELTLYYKEFVGFTPPSVALAGLTLARFVCEKERRIMEETAECLEVVQHIDDRFSQSQSELPEILVRKYSQVSYSNAVSRVLQFYLKGSRFVCQTLALIPSSIASEPAQTTHY